MHLMKFVSYELDVYLFFYKIHKFQNTQMVSAFLTTSLYCIRACMQARRDMLRCQGGLARRQPLLRRAQKQ